jgi:hypothetical protein
MGHRKIAEVKDVKRLTKGHIDSVVEKYRYPFFPKEGYDVDITKRTEVPEDVREYARRKKVKIVRLRY